MWDGNSFKKVKFTFFEIGLTVVNKVVRALVISNDYFFCPLSNLFLNLLKIYPIYEIMPFIEFRKCRKMVEKTNVYNYLSISMVIYKQNNVFLSLSQLDFVLYFEILSFPL